jgi:NAD(P)-dependent dehydrogenase (short-subunit alcohol dehydrogenase family)
MQVQDKVVVITGAASGIGRGLAERFHREGAAHVVVVDRDGEGAAEVAAGIGGTGVGVDVSDEAAIRELVHRTEEEHGPIELFVSNAGYVTVGGLEVSNEEIQKMWEVHVMAHVYAARAVVPGMIERGSGYLLNTASAAGLLSQIGSLAYTMTKHAAVALAEWLAITHGEQGLRVSVLCPQAVATNIGANSPSRGRTGTSPGVASGDGVLSSEQVADCVIDALDEERFWVLPHPEVQEYVRRKATDVDRWLRGMQRFQGQLYEGREMPGEWLVGGLSK